MGTVGRPSPAEHARLHSCSDPPRTDEAWPVSAQKFLPLGWQTSEQHCPPTRRRPACHARTFNPLHCALDAVELIDASDIRRKSGRTLVSSVELIKDLRSIFTHRGQDLPRHLAYSLDADDSDPEDPHAYETIEGIGIGML